MAHNDSIGSIDCGHCNGPAEVRKYRTGRGLLYYHCKNCGVIQLGYPGGQDWILAHATMYGPEGKPKPAPTAAPAVLDVKPAAKPLPVAAAPATPPPAKPRGGSFLNDWMP